MVIGPIIKKVIKETVKKGSKGKGKRFLDFIETGKLVDKKGVKINVPKAAERLTGKPHVDRVKKAGGGSPHSTDEGKKAALKRSFNRMRKFGVSKSMLRKKEREMEPFSGGGRATHGYGKAYMKGGKVK